MDTLDRRKHHTFGHFSHSPHCPPLTVASELANQVAATSPRSPSWYYPRFVSTPTRRLFRRKFGDTSSNPPDDGDGLGCKAACRLNCVSANYRADDYAHIASIENPNAIVLQPFGQPRSEPPRNQRQVAARRRKRRLWEILQKDWLEKPSKTLPHTIFSLVSAWRQPRGDPFQMHFRATTSSAPQTLG
ncbi:hypothetical protein Cob_v001872 [Colletotrichum orbiculare MAFF 240422]|uniref:Uncharacterized protein n=1 Tax=Colletotrichum orbiculare (strain 104-T / ATCC 96160 / CBS 514.97 / LARS 414 / MAFF 240422) TaxID=1213857 RepID=A0A484G688_COLOR|nr:hypothetical protein Cob_v001872 [Colletotrichum orbiculare MAFF 240422]